MKTADLSLDSEFLLSITDAEASPEYKGKLMLASSWEQATDTSGNIKCKDPTGFWMSEKLDGVRAILTHDGLHTRTGLRIITPSWFPRPPKGLALDGELWAGRNKFNIAQSNAMALTPRSYDWQNILTFQVFDSISNSNLDECFEDRLMNACKFVLEGQSNWSKESRCNGIDIIDVSQQYPIRMIKHIPCKGADHLQEFYKSVTAEGAEGVMLRAPRSSYVQGRSRDLYKLKQSEDCEAEVIGYIPSKKNRYNRTKPDIFLLKSHSCGSLRCKLTSNNDIKFSVGSGLSEEELLNPPEIGSIITIKCNGFNPSGKPRHPVFLRERGVV